mmetsp:Transcript_380/g.959  ORF Transcript_380/g.959 Transcript_380/m.959 type:complete len:223 (+) Transcript_380:1028-1696(+)
MCAPPPLAVAMFPAIVHDVMITLAPERRYTPPPEPSMSSTSSPRVPFAVLPSIVTDCSVASAPDEKWMPPPKPSTPVALLAATWVSTIVTFEPDDTDMPPRYGELFPVMVHLRTVARWPARIDSPPTSTPSLPSMRVSSKSASVVSPPQQMRIPPTPATSSSPSTRTRLAEKVQPRTAASDATMCSGELRPSVPDMLSEFARNVQSSMVMVLCATLTMIGPA